MHEHSTNTASMKDVVFHGIIDHQVVCYGSMNFLGKEDADDNLMRVVDGKIAGELLEMTFGKNKYQGESL